MYCRKCGREIPDDSVMCGYCGTPVNPDNPYTYGGTPQNMDEGANGLGIASMILGIVAILLACCAGGKWLTFLVAAAGFLELSHYRSQSTEAAEGWHLQG